MIIIQLTGLSGSGKTTLANAIKLHLSLLNYDIEILDGDELRKTGELRPGAIPRDSA